MTDDQTRIEVRPFRFPRSWVPRAAAFLIFLASIAILTSLFGVLDDVREQRALSASGIVFALALWAVVWDKLAAAFQRIQALENEVEVLRGQRSSGS